MSWGGNNKPCGTATLMSIGQLGVEQNKKHAAVLFPLIEKELGIPGDRFVYIVFVFITSYHNLYYFVILDCI